MAAHPADLADFEAFIAERLRHRTGDERAELERYLRAHPGHTVRDWKGKGDPDFLNPHDLGEREWKRLKATDLRALALDDIARHLPRNVRQAAARDPMLIFNELARRYRLRVADDPPPLAPEFKAQPTRGQKVEDPSSEKRVQSSNITLKLKSTEFGGDVK